MKRGAGVVTALAAGATIGFLIYCLHTLYHGTQKFLDIIATALESFS